MARPITITDVRTILTQPAGARLVVVKVETSEPGLYGLGCATFTQRCHAVAAAVEQHLKPFALGRDVTRSEDFFQHGLVNGYWRNGPVLNNALSGLDMALWDIKGKLAGMPVYDLLGGKCREAATVYAQADGRDAAEVLANVQKLHALGYRYIRVQLGLYTGHTEAAHKPEGALPGAYYDPRDYARATLAMLEYIRAQVGDTVELLHDVHERLRPIEAVQFAKDMEQFRLFYLEDVLAPEDVAWFAEIRRLCATPIATGELFTSPSEWTPLLVNRQIDFLRLHTSAVGGLTPARNAALLAGAFGVRTAWHGPPDVSPVGHAANLHLDLWAPNFGIQEWCRLPESYYEVFPGMPVVRDGYMYPNDLPGLGVDIDEVAAAKYPVKDYVEQWTQVRLPDGGPARP
jgi:mannonate dehydratase